MTYRHPLPNANVGMDHTIVADLRTGTDDDVRVNDRARSDGRAGADRYKRPDRGVDANRGIRRNRRKSIHAFGGHVWSSEQRDGTRERRVWLVASQKCAGLQWSSRLLNANDHGGRLRRLELGEISMIREEAQVAPLRVLDGRDTHDVDVAVAFQTTAKMFGDVSELQYRSLRVSGRS